MKGTLSHKWCCAIAEHNLVENIDDLEMISPVLRDDLRMYLEPGLQKHLWNGTCQTWGWEMIEGVEAPWMGKYETPTGVVTWHKPAAGGGIHTIYTAHEGGKHTIKLYPNGEIHTISNTIGPSVYNRRIEEVAFHPNGSLSTYIVFRNTVMMPIIVGEWNKDGVPTRLEPDTSQHSIKGFAVEWRTKKEGGNRPEDVERWQQLWALGVKVKAQAQLSLPPPASMLPDRHHHHYPEADDDAQLNGGIPRAKKT